MYKKIISYVDCMDLLAEDIIKAGNEIDKNGGDGLYLYNFTQDEYKREEFLGQVKSLLKEIDIPIYLGTYINRLEDVKKALYTGASYVVIPHTLTDETVIEESLKRFGNKIILETDLDSIRTKLDTISEWLLLSLNSLLLHCDRRCKEENYNFLPSSIPYIIKTTNIYEDAYRLKEKQVIGLTCKYKPDCNLFKLKEELGKQSIHVNQFTSSLNFQDFKVNTDGLIPVVTTDYKTGEVLMLAYMNEASFLKTIETGKMTYYSRSRNELWIKGASSGHYQYVMSLDIDCDKDTILAKVKQIGPACHTGAQSCFYTNLVKREYHDTNPLTVLNKVYSIIKDRKENPKEGSYTNYLFDKGIDKILKKCGEEATEIIIAAKNPNAEELKYEISDFLYHMLVLMVEVGLDLDDIMKELSNR